MYIFLSYLHILLLFFLDRIPEFELVALRATCVDSAYDFIGSTSAGSCAKECAIRGVSIFDLQRTEYCNGEDNCYCFCVTTANPDGPCAMTTINDYDTYKVLKGMNHLYSDIFTEKFC